MSYTAKISDVWKAKIDLVPMPPEVEAEAKFYIGDKEVTDLSDYSRKWVAKFGEPDAA